MGAWIETMTDELMMKSYGVAPHVGAWIETIIFVDAAVAPSSHLM